VKNQKFTKTLKMLQKSKKKTQNYLEKKCLVMGIGGKSKRLI
jgi:lipoate synthase